MRRSREQVATFCKVRAEQLRASPTRGEKALAAYLTGLGFRMSYFMEIPHVRKEGVIYPVIFDFYNPERRIAIEVDGHVHAKTRGADRRRDTWSARAGIRVIRVSNEQVASGEAVPLIEAAMGARR